MKITQIDVERYGLWEDLKLPVNEHGLTVFYGPNEAGKSTLMRFIRSMLYGFPEEQPWKLGRRQRFAMQQRGGSLRLRHRTQSHVLHRLSNGLDRGTIQLDGQDGPQAERQLREMLYDVPEAIYHNIYAVGLKELQQLATLGQKEVADRIYALSLGPEGKSLIRAGELGEQRSRDYFDPSTRQGRLTSLKSSYDERSARTSAPQKGVREYLDLDQRQKILEGEIGEQKKRREGLQQELRAYRLLERAWRPWKRQQQLQSELEGLPARHQLPENGPQRLTRIEEELRELEAERNQMQAELRHRRERLNELGDAPELQRHMGTIQALLDQREWIEEAERRESGARADAALLKNELDEKVDAIGPQWNLQRLEAADTSPDAHFRLVQAAQAFQNALRKRGRFRKFYQKKADKCHERRQAVEQQVRELHEGSLPSAIAESESRLANLEVLAKLRIEQAELEQRLLGLDEQLGRLRTKIDLPWWAYVMLWSFASVGVFLFCAGLYKSVTTSWIIGAIYALTGVMCGGLTWALRLHYEADVREQVDALQRQRMQLEHDLSRSEQMVNELLEADCHWLSQHMEDTSAPVVISEASLMRHATLYLDDLKRLSKRQDWVDRTRRKLSSYRAKMPTYQRQVNAAREKWFETLRRLGFEETIRVPEALGRWQRAFEANEYKREWEAMQREIEHHQRTLKIFRERMQKLAQRMNLQHHEGRSVTELLSLWQQRYGDFESHVGERSELSKAYQTLRKDQRTIANRINELQESRRALLTQAGVGNRKELIAVYEKLNRVDDIEQELELVSEELLRLSRNEPNFAVVEEDLRGFNEQENRERVELLEIELQDLEQDLEKSHEVLGQIRHRLTSLEQDRTEVSQRFEKRQAQSKLDRAVEEWAGTLRAQEAIGQLQERYEKSSQPRTLADASRILARLTENRYQTIWAPLGANYLCVDNARHETFRVEQLSSGTREQLFLAIRLAMIQEMAELNVELPVVLDDVFVNFDRHRTEAAVDTLMEFTEDGTQVLLFTCHEHLANQFQERDVEPILLPNYRDAGEGTMVTERRAG